MGGRPNGHERGKQRPGAIAEFEGMSGGTGREKGVKEGGEGRGMRMGERKRTEQGRRSR